MNKLKYICGLLLSLIISCSENNEKTLIMGTSADYPPFESMNNGEFIGFDTDLAHLITKKLGYKLVVKDMEFSSLIPALSSGVIDFAMSSINPTPERKNNISFSNTYYRSIPAIISKSSNLVNSLEDLKQKTIGVQLGSVWESYIKNKQNDITQLSIYSAGKIPQLIQELKIDRINAIILEQEQAREIIKKDTSLNYKMLDDYGHGYAAAFKKNSYLKKEFDKVLEDIAVNGEFDNIKSKWLK